MQETTCVQETSLSDEIRHLAGGIQNTKRAEKLDYEAKILTNEIILEGLMPPFCRDGSFLGACGSRWGKLRGGRTPDWSWRSLAQRRAGYHGLPCGNYYLVDLSLDKCFLKIRKI